MFIKLQLCPRHQVITVSWVVQPKFGGDLEQRWFLCWHQEADLSASRIGLIWKTLRI